MRRTTLGPIALAALLGLAATAHAGLIPAGVTVAPDGGGFRYKYNIQLPSDYKVKTGDFFTIYDFHGFAGGPTLQPAGWDFSTALLGPYPPRILPNDDPAVANLTWTYTGPDLTTPGSLGLFEAISSVGPHLSQTDFASQDHRALDGRAVGNYTFADAPDPMMPDAPEPASLALLGMGLPLAGAAAWLRRRRA